MAAPAFLVLNGTYDDPASANNGPVAADMRVRCEQADLPASVAPYLTWRFAAMACGTVLWVAKVFTTVPLDDGQKYRDFLTHVPGKLQANNQFDRLVDVLVLVDKVLFTSNAMAMVLFALATILAAPHFALDSFKTSRRLVWVSWAVSFCPMFLIFLFFPLRSAVEWDSLVHRICEQSIDGAVSMPGSELKAGLVFGARHGLLDAAFAADAEGGQEAEDNAAVTVDMFPSRVTDFCERHGDDWQDAFFGNSVPCVWELEDICHRELCPTRPDIVSCFTGCLSLATRTYGTEVILSAWKTCGTTTNTSSVNNAGTTHTSSGIRMRRGLVAHTPPLCVDDDSLLRTVAAAFDFDSAVISAGSDSCAEVVADDKTVCDLTASILTGDDDDDGDGVEKIISIAGEVCCLSCFVARMMANNGGGIDAVSAAVQSAELARLPAVFTRAIQFQRVAVQDVSEIATGAAIHTEFVVGVMVGIVAGKLLVPASLSLLGGLAEAAMNLKAMLPGAPLGGQLLILVSAEALPVYIAILAIFTQIIGDVVMNLLFVLLTLYLSLGIFTGMRILHLDDTQRDTLYARAWAEYFARAVIVSAALATAVYWITSTLTSSLVGAIRDTLLTPEFVLLSILDILSRKISTAVAGTDALVVAMCHGMLWTHEHLSADARKQQLDLLRGIRGMGVSSDAFPRSVSVEPAGLEKTGTSQK